MNWDQIQGKWMQLKGEAKNEWAKLTDDDVERAEGNKDKLVGIIQEKYGKSKEEVQTEVDSWMRRIS